MPLDTELNNEWKTMIYLFPAWDTGKGPKQSTATRSKAPLTGRGNKGAFGLCFGSFFMAQFTQNLHQSAQHPCTYHTSSNVCGACHMSYVHLNALHAVTLYAWREARQYLGIFYFSSTHLSQMHQSNNIILYSAMLHSFYGHLSRKLHALNPMAHCSVRIMVHRTNRIHCMWLSKT